MASVQRTAEVTWSGSIARGSGVTSGGSGAIRALPVTLASRMGAPAGKTSPEELIAAAHAGSFAMELGSILAVRGTPPAHLHVTATLTLEKAVIPEIGSIALDVHAVVPGTDEAGFHRAAYEAEQTCVVSRALRGGGVHINVKATLEEPALEEGATPSAA